MKAKLSIIAGIIFICFLGISAVVMFNKATAGTLSCTVTSTCVSPSIGVLYLASTTNSHSALASSSGYTNIVCCSGVGSLGNSCSGVGATSTFLHLASSTNSHVEENTQNNYPSSSYACLSVGTGGSVSVGYVTSTSCQAAGFDTALVSIASTTNSHAAVPGSSTFQAGSTIQVCASAVTPPPTVTNVLLNGGSSITLLPNATTSINLTYTVTDYTTNGCSDIFTNGNITSTAFLDTVSSTCENTPTANNLNCYVTTLAGSVNSCGGSTSTSATATDTLNIYYFARSSGVPSSSYPNDHWYGYVAVKTQGGVTSTATSSPVDINALSALSVSTPSIAFGTMLPNTNTGSVNQNVTVSNVGNTSNTPELSGTVFVHGANSFATSSEHYASSSFTFGGAEQQMNTNATIIPGVTLTAPTSTGGGGSSFGGYTYTRSITVTSTTSIASGTNTNFPMLFSGTYSWLESTSTAGGAGRIQNLVTAPGGSQEPADLVFATSTSNCGSPLNFETESYVSSTGAIVDWINVPSESAGTVIYACYGKVSVTTDQSHPSSTWNSNYAGVWHLSGNPNDSTGNANNGTWTGTASGSSTYYSAGTIGPYAGYFDGSTDYLTGTFPSVNSSTGAANTVSFWMNWNGATAAFVQVGGLNVLYNVSCLAINDNTSYFGTTATVPTNQWVFITAVMYNGSSSYTSDEVYINGVAEPMSLCYGSALTGNAGSTIEVGAYYGYAYFFTKTIGDMDISTGALSPSWILTEYNNQNSPSTFYTVGSEQTASGGSGNPSATIYFGLQVPLNIASGTYTATDTFTGLFSN